MGATRQMLHGKLGINILLNHLRDYLVSRILQCAITCSYKKSIFYIVLSHNRKEQRHHTDPIFKKNLFHVQ